MNKERSSLQESGFGLVELLVTVSIVSILAGISLVGFEVFRKKAYNVVAEIKLKDLHTGGLAILQEMQDQNVTSIGGGAQLDYGFSPNTDTVTDNVSIYNDSLDASTLFPISETSELAFQIQVGVDTLAGDIVTVSSMHCNGDKYVRITDSSRFGIHRFSHEAGSSAYDFFYNQHCL